MTKDEEKRLKEIYLRACVCKERATDALVRARMTGCRLTGKQASHAIATARCCAVMDVMMVFFDDATIDAIESEARRKLLADPMLFVED